MHGARDETRSELDIGPPNQGFLNAGGQEYGLHLIDTTVCFARWLSFVDPQG